MIGVVAEEGQQTAAREFFELFKTSWEFYQPGHEYEVVVYAADGQVSEVAAKLIVVYGGRPLAGEAAGQTLAGRVLSFGGRRLPLYGDSLTLGEDAGSALIVESSGDAVLRRERRPDGVRARVGYDLFGEVQFLLTRGQPEVHAGIPTLELHIAILRDLILAAGASLVEIPPVPAGYRFIACLTHDVDHPFVCAHKLDHTILGFLYRATAGSLMQVLRGRRPVRFLLQNLAAVLKLPLVHLGLAGDYWAKFDRYPAIERARSSFFIIPFRDNPGKKDGSEAPNKRAARYGAADVAGQVRKVMAEGCEVGLHGLDAWCDRARATEELEEIRSVTGAQEIGVRMHWLYYSQDSPVLLEQAGADYDSTVGYNGTVGYRAGTGQVYKPLQTARLLELPLHIMDTALFYPSHLNLSAAEARETVDRILDNAVRFGGSVTINWHDRSIAPERQWDNFYVELLEGLRRRGAWLATAAETVAWFRMRRTAAFGQSGKLAESFHWNTQPLPGLRISAHGAPEPAAPTLTGR